VQLTTCLKALALASCFFFYSNAVLAQTTLPSADCSATTYTGQFNNTQSGIAFNPADANPAGYNQDELRCETLDMNDDNFVDNVVDLNIPLDDNGNPVAYEDASGGMVFSNNTITNKVISTTFAINTALQAAGVGIEIRGLRYEWEVKKPDANSALELKVNILLGNGQTLYQAIYNYDGQQFVDWTAFDADDPPGAGFQVADDWTIKSTMTGNGQGSGVRNIKYTISYAPVVGHEDDFSDTYDYGLTAFENQCAADPISSEQCPGYQQAYTDQQCANDPLYNSSCAGYQQAYTDQQCKNDPLYNSSCAGYEQAYTDQQCSQDPLYDQSCAGYQQAYDAYEEQQFEEQCIMDTQSDTMCLGYIEPQLETYDDPNTTSNDGQDDGSNSGNPELETFIESDPVDQSTGMVDTNSGVDIQNTTGIDIEAATGVDLEATTGINIEEQTGQQDFSEPPPPEEIYEDPIVDVSTGEDVQATTGIDLEQSTGVDVEAATGIIDTQEEFTEPVEIFTDPVEEFTEVEMFTETVEVFEEPIVEQPEAIIEEIEETVESVEEIINDEGTIKETDETTRTEESVEERIEEEIILEEELESSVETVSKRSSVKTKALNIAGAATTAAEQVASTQAQQSIQSSASTGTSNTEQNTGSIGNSNTGNTESSANNSGIGAGQDTGNFANNSGAGSRGSQSSFSTGNNNSMQNFSTGQTTLQQGDSGIAALNSGTSTEMLTGTGMSTIDITGTTDYGQTQESTYSYSGNIDATVAAEISSIIAAEINALIIDTTKRALEESNQMGEPLDEVSPEDLLEQQQLEDDLVAKAIAGDESDEAQSALLGYNPNFRDYVQPQMKVEAQWYSSDGIYEMQQNYDNPNQRFFNGASDVKHRAMVRQQYGEK